MDYRELENRLQRNRDMIKERAHDRLVEEINQANKVQRVSRFAWLWAGVLSVLRRKPEPLPPVPLKAPQQLKQP